MASEFGMQHKCIDLIYMLVIFMYKNPAVCGQTAADSETLRLRG